MENGFPKLSRAHTVSDGRLVETTPKVNREVAESAMLLSQGARRAIEMRNELTQCIDSAMTQHRPPSP